MGKGGRPSSTLVGRGARWRFSQLPWVSSEKAIRGVEKKRRRAASGAKGRVINSRSSSGSVSIVGVMGQMSAALMALPDAWIAPCPRP